MATLRYLWENQEQTFSLRDTTTIGRADVNDLHIPADSLSRQHAIITRAGDDYIITDLGSSNGIEVSGRGVKTLALVNGLTFKMGDVIFTFQADGAAPVEEPDVPVVVVPPLTAPPVLRPPTITAPVQAIDQERAVEQLATARATILAELGRVIIGQKQVLDEILVTLFSQGHCLIIGVPGLAKTLMVRALAASLHLDTKRIQFTPDLMPSDITGTDILEEDPTTKRRTFRFNKGPLFTNMLLADEINRTPPKTQAALLEAMQERRVTTAGTTYDLPAPFMVLATQNPIEQEGTYPLPEAQLDRFMFAINITYPTLEEEQRVLVETTRDLQWDIQPVLEADAILKFQHLVRQVPISDHVALYATTIVRATRPGSPTAPDFINRWVRWGAGPRAGQYLLLAAKAHTLLSGRFSVSCADIREYALPVLRHRLFCNFAAASEGVSPDDIVRRVLEAVKEPAY
jgi:MoxR-like ATPase